MQGCETFSFETETRPRPFETQTETFFEMSQTVQPVKLLASNFYKLCCVFHLLRKTQLSVSNCSTETFALFSQRLLAI